MNLDSHLSALTQKHTNLETTILKEVQRPSPDSVRLMALKKEKLKLKEQIRDFR